MTHLEYKEMTAKLRARLSEIDTERADLDVRRADLDKEAANIKDAIAKFLPLCGEVADPNDLSGLGFTNAIRKVLSLKRGEWIPASEVKETLGQKGFELSGYTNPMASIYKILSRLSDSQEIDFKLEGFNAFYRMKKRRSLFRPLSRESAVFKSGMRGNEEPK